MARWLVFAVSAFLIGLTKAGLDGGALIAVPLMAAAFGGRCSALASARLSEDRFRTRPSG